MTNILVCGYGHHSSLALIAALEQAGQSTVNVETLVLENTYPSLGREPILVEIIPHKKSMLW